MCLGWRISLASLIFVWGASNFGETAGAGPYDPIWIEPSSSQRSTIEKALAEPAEFDFQETPLNKVVEAIQAKSSLPMRLDKRALDEAGIALDTPITRKIKFLSLQAALDLVLRDLDLTAVTRSGELLITTTSMAETIVDAVIYPVSDLLLPPESLRTPGRHYRPDYDSLIEIIASSIAPTRWVEVGGAAPIRPYKGTLIISQTQDVHAEILDMLTELRRVRDVQFSAAGEKKTTPQLSAAERPREAVREALRQAADFNFKDAGLSDIANAIGEKFKVPVQVDSKALEEAGVNPAKVAPQRLRGPTLRDALDQALREHELDWTITRDGVLLLTSRAQAETMYETRVYPILGLGTRAPADPHRHLCEEYDTVVELVTSTVAPTTWGEVGGAGCVRALASGAALVVSQTSRQQMEVESLLASLRSIAERDQLESDRGECLGRNPDELIELSYGLPTRLGVYREWVRQETPARAEGKPEAGPLGVPAATVAHDIPPTFAQRESMAQQVADAIKKFVEPKSWEAAGGEGTITLIGDRLLISQRIGVHDQIVQFLAKFDGYGLYGMGGL